MLELLKTHIVCTWDISSSVYYLTLKALAEESSAEFEKYGNLAAGIFAELFDSSNVGGRAKEEVLLVDSYGEEIRDGYTIPNARWGHGATGGMTGALKAFVSSLVWLANRSIFYSLTAKYLKSDTFLYPIRQTYQQHYMSSTCKYGFDFTKKVVDVFSKTLSADLISIQESGLAVATATDLPVFAAWLARETGDAVQVIHAAMEIRNDREIVEARDQLREIRRLFDEVGIAEANKAVRKIVSDLSKSSERLRSRYGIGTKQGTPITRLIRVYNTIAAIQNLPQLPEYDIKIKLPEFLPNLSTASGFNALYRNVGDDLSTVWALGEARDILGARVRLYRDGQAAHSPKAENPEYRWAHSTWKSPM